MCNEQRPRKQQQRNAGQHKEQGGKTGERQLHMLMEKSGWKPAAAMEKKADARDWECKLCCTLSVAPIGTGIFSGYTYLFWRCTAV